MLKDVLMGKIGLTMERGTIVSWLKNEDDYVEKGEPLFEVETDKATQVIESFHSGYLRKILVPAGQEGAQLPERAIFPIKIASREKLSGIRKVVAERMTASFSEAPHIHLELFINMTEAVTLRERMNSDSSTGVHLTYSYEPPPEHFESIYMSTRPFTMGPLPSTMR